jgi:speckle-type POZ protein
MNAPCQSSCFKQLLFSKDFSDVTLVSSDGKEIPVHRCILAARSSVFKTMVEKKSGVIVVDDIDGETMREMLRFIYTGTVENFETIALKLIYAAEKYDLPDLKSMCDTKLTKQISQENVLEYLKLAEKSDLNELFFRSMDFIQT